MTHHITDIMSIFNQCFQKDYQTILVRGNDEPLYLPAHDKSPYHQVIFAHGFFSSALHEIAHWLIAGAKRRELLDYGYWYQPDGRTAEQQRIFEQVEVKPQALEWIMSQSCGYRFHFSFDNLNGEMGDTSVFKKSIYQQVIAYCETGLSPRAETLRQALCAFYQTPQQLSPSLFEFAF